MRTYAEWQSMTTALSIESRAFIAGKYVTAQSDMTFPVLNPATGKVLTQVVGAVPFTCW